MKSQILVIGFWLFASATGRIGLRAGEYRIQAILTTADPVPGDTAGDGWNIAEIRKVFVTALLNDRHHVTVLGTVRQRQPYRAIFRFRDGTLAQVVREGAHLAGMNSIVDLGGQNRIENLGFLDRILLGPEGQVAFQGVIEPAPAESQVGWWIAEEDGIQMVMRDGNPAPGFGTGHVYQAAQPSLALGSQGRIALSSSVSDAEPRGLRTVWSGKPGFLTPKFREMDPAPGTSSTFAGTDLPGRVTLTKSGGILVVAQVKSDFDAFKANTGLWLATDRSVELLVPPHFSLPEFGTDVAVQLASFAGASDVNSAGQFVTTALLEGPGLTSASRFCLISGTVEGVRIVGRGGQAVPAIPGATYLKFTRPIINSTGRIAVWTTLKSTDGDPFVALMVDRGRGLEFVLRIGGPALEFGPGVILTLAGNSLLFINAAGQILVGAKTGPASAAGPFENVLYLVEPNLSVHRVAWVERSVRLANGETAILKSISDSATPPAGDEDGNSQELNAAGDFTFVGTGEAAGTTQVGVLLATPSTELRIRLQRRLALDHGDWENVGFVVAGDGKEVTSHLFPEARDTEEFFRVLTVP